MIMIVVRTVYLGCTLANLENQWKCNKVKKKKKDKEIGRSKKIGRIGNDYIRTAKGLCFERPSCTLSRLGHYLKLH